jgi:hypothetical protein
MVMLLSFFLIEWSFSFGNGYALNDNGPFLQMTQHNVGALVVVKSGQDKSIAGIVTERGIELLCLLAFKLCLMEEYRTIFYYNTTLF